MDLLAILGIFPVFIFFFVIAFAANGDLRRWIGVRGVFLLAAFGAVIWLLIGVWMWFLVFGRNSYGTEYAFLMGFLFSIFPLPIWCGQLCEHLWSKRLKDRG